MKLYLILLIAPLALAGHCSACVVPGGKRDKDATVSCCSDQEGAGPEGLTYSGKYKDCRNSPLSTGRNNIDSGKFASCCTDHGFGSVGE